MKCVLATMVVLASSGAWADDLAQPSWSGVYAGVHAGAGQQNLSGIFDQNGSPGGPYNLGDFVAKGFVGGVHVGVNHQWDAIVLGIEGDIDITGMHDGREGAPLAGSTINVATDVDVLASLRGRVGLAIDNMLIYGTAGIGFAKSSFTSTFTNVFTPETASVSGQDWGPVYGGGLEYGKGAFVFRVEALHYDVNSSHTFAFGEIPDADNNDVVNWNGITVVRAGISYKIGMPGSQ